MARLLCVGLACGALAACGGDSGSRLSRMEYDYVDPERTDMVFAYYYNHMGISHAERIVGGTVTETTTVTTENGRMVTVVGGTCNATFLYDNAGRNYRIEEDCDKDRVTDRIGEVTYDDHGYRSGVTWDTDADGTPDDSSTYTNTYDASGRLIAREEQRDGSSSTWNSVYGYDADDNLTSITHYHPDGSLDYTVTLTWENGPGNWFTRDRY